MKILYGVQGTGNGHIARARLMLPELQRAGISADFLFSGTDAAALFDMACFGEVRIFHGFSFSSRNGQVDYWNTLKNLQPLQFFRDVRALDLRDYDAVLTDFEPVSARAARRQKIRLIGLGNQYALRYPLPDFRAPAFTGKLLAHFAPADIYLGMHWTRFHAEVLPPLCPPPPAENVPEEDFVLVYFPVENPEEIAQMLRRLPEQTFRIYGKFPAESRQDNLIFCPLSRANFLRDLAACAGVMCNSGFGVCSEALQAGKKILTRPLEKQYEQQVNARILQQVRRAEILRRHDTGQIRSWLAAENPAPVYFPNTARAVVQWLAEGGQESVAALSKRLWQQVDENNVHLNAEIQADKF